MHLAGRFCLRKNSYIRIKQLSRSFFIHWPQDKPCAACMHVFRMSIAVKDSTENTKSKRWPQQNTVGIENSQRHKELHSRNEKSTNYEGLKPKSERFQRRAPGRLICENLVASLCALLARFIIRGDPGETWNVCVILIAATFGTRCR